MLGIRLDKYSSIYFIGIGGIGMSALARYFLNQGKKVGGYDRCPSELTEKLISEGAWIHHTDDTEEIPPCFTSLENTLVIYTPAIPKSMSELKYFQSHKFLVAKRAEILGLISRSSSGLCVAGTHGKTTTSAMLANILNESTWKCNAFLGGIATNFNSNFILSSTSQWTIF
ncbi:MAG: UDP-N-acetylmuramate--L-alanine ligase, partial [Bacteroidetes bacterium]|nr:UDP-N-acetylmuramate--L-alanine ligase [Bacteroidota bacterium]